MNVHPTSPHWRLGQYAVIADNGQPRRISPEEICQLLDKQAKMKRNPVPE